MSALPLTQKIIGWIDPKVLLPLTAPAKRKGVNSTCAVSHAESNKTNAYSMLHSVLSTMHVVIISSVYCLMVSSWCVDTDLLEAEENKQ